MLHYSTRRGRPKGTGIDDSDRIARLDELLRVRPESQTDNRHSPDGIFRSFGYSPPAR